MLIAPAQKYSCLPVLEETGDLGVVEGVARDCGDL